MSTIKSKAHVASALLMAATIATTIAMATAPAEANSLAKYNKHHVSKKASFHALKHHAKSLKKSGVAKVTKIRRHGKVVGFKKTLTSGDKIVIKRGRRGRIHKTILKRKSFIQRIKHKVSSATKALKKRAKYSRFSQIGKPIIKKY